MKKTLQSYLAVVAYFDLRGGSQLWTRHIDASSQHDAFEEANQLFFVDVGDNYVDATSTRVFPMGPAHLGNAVKAALANHDGACLDNAAEVDKVTRAVVKAVSRRS